MAASFEKIFVNIPQLTNERDWLVWKFQVQYALRASGQWDFITGTASRLKVMRTRSKGLLLSSTIYWPDIYANGDGISDSQGHVGCALSAF